MGLGVSAVTGTVYDSDFVSEYFLCLRVESNRLIRIATIYERRAYIKFKLHDIRHRYQLIVGRLRGSGGGEVESHRRRSYISSILVLRLAVAWQWRDSESESESDRFRRPRRVEDSNHSGGCDTTFAEYNLDAFNFKSLCPA